ncbi:MAG: hypothetical protein IKN74_05700 [Clostridia bacterium]|nr:hypothetical protein [Clostridia bacterium]
MEQIKNIFFDTDVLTPFQKIKISYAGKLFQENSKRIFISYGFGPKWEESAKVEMVLSELGYQVEVDLINKDTFNFKFIDDKNNIDDNNSLDYVFTLQPPEQSLMVIDQKPVMKARRLRKSYLLFKKFRIAMYKAFIMIPRIISDSYLKNEDK